MKGGGDTSCCSDVALTCSFTVHQRKGAVVYEQIGTELLSESFKLYFAFCVSDKTLGVASGYYRPGPLRNHAVVKNRPKQNCVAAFTHMKR